MYSIIGTKVERSFVEHVMFISSNINLPVHFEQFDNSRTAQFAGCYSLHGDFIFIWVANIFENLLKVAIIASSDSSRAITKSFPLLTDNNIWCIVFMSEVFVVLLLGIIFKSIYMWYELLGIKTTILEASFTE